MRFILLNYDGCLLPWAAVLAREEQDVVLVNPVKGETTRTVGEGIVRVEQTIPEDREAIYVFDSTAGEAGKVASKLKSSGYTVLGAGELNWRMERDRAWAAEIAEGLGMLIPEIHEFRSPADALKFLKSNKGDYVWKPEKDAEAHFTYVDPPSLAVWLEWLSREYPDTPGILQEYVDGTTVSVSCWYDGEDFLLWWILFEDKKFRGPGLGPSTGCEISVVAPSFEPPQVLDWDKFLRFLRDNDMPPGEYDVNMIVTDGDPYFLEWGPRFGWDMDVVYLPVLSSLSGALSLIAGKGEGVDVTPHLCIGVRLSVPPYPYVPKEGDKGASGLPVWVEEEALWRAVYLYSVRDDPEKGLILADPSGLVGVAVGEGPTASDALESLEDALDSIKVPDLGYRPDYAEYVNSVKDFVEDFELEEEPGEDEEDEEDDFEDFEDEEEEDVLENSAS